MNKSDMSKSSERLWLAIRLPYLPLEAVACQFANEKPSVVTEKQRVICANHSALQAGVSVGMPQATAQALSNCDTHERDQMLETQVLKALAESAYRFTPYVEFYRKDTLMETGLLLEISRCLNLFDGLTNLYQLVVNFFQAIYPDYTLCYGLAHTAPGAWLLSYDEMSYGGLSREELSREELSREELSREETPSLETPEGIPDKQHFLQRLQKLPVQLLREYPQAVESLEKTGFETLGDIVKQINSQSLAPLRKRFGDGFCRHISETFAIENNFEQKTLFEKPRTTYTPKEYFNQNMQFDHPVDGIDLLKPPMEALLQELDIYLNQRQLQTQGVEWRLYDIYQNKKVIKVNCIGARRGGKTSWKLLFDLSVIQFESMQLPFEVDILELECQHATRQEGINGKLSFDGKHAGNDSELEITLAKLTARLGDKAVYKVSYHNNHIPEKSCEMIPLNQIANTELPVAQQVASRPGWLLNSPVPIRYRNNQLEWQGKLDLIQGPERIEGNWWDTPTKRDYFVAQREDNLRVWVFYDLNNEEWYAHGVF